MAKPKRKPALRRPAPPAPDAPDSGAHLDPRTRGDGRVHPLDPRAWDQRAWLSDQADLRQSCARYVSEPLDHYEQGALLTDRQLAAGRQFGAIYRTVHPPVRLSARWHTASDPHPDDEAFDELLDPEARLEAASADLRHALAALPARLHEGLIDVCARREYSSRAGALPDLRDALDRLVTLWGLA